MLRFWLIVATVLCVVMGLSAWSLGAVLPARWLTYKERIVLPYLEESLNTSEKVHPQSLQERLDAWSRQVF